MLRNYWYLIALSVVVSIISISASNCFPALLFYSWMLLLLVLKKIKLPLILLLLLVSLASYMYLPSKTPPQGHLSGTPSNNQITLGRITSPIDKTDKTITFEFKNENNKKQIVTYFKQYPEEQLDNTIQHGSSCKIKGEETIPQFATNPHQFDYQNYLWQKGIESQYILTDTENMICTNHSALSYIYTLRELLLDSTKNKFSEGTIKWLHALVLGDNSLMDKQVIDVFERWGLSHILAISGLHIGIIIGLLFFCFVRLQWLTKEQTKIFLCLFLPVYALLAGGQPSVWRASLMVIIVILLTFLQRRVSYTDLISMTFILLILMDKYIVYHIGFQLSFAVTFGIILSRKWLASSKSPLEGLFKISFVSQMVILPLQLHYFSIFDPLSILLNIVVVPYFSLFVIPAMFIFLLLIVFPKEFLSILDTSFLFVHENALSIILWVDEHLHFPFIIGKLPLYFIFLYYFCFILFMISLEKENNKKAFFCGLILSLYIAFLAVRPYFSPYGTVTMLDIGQGDAFVIEMPYRQGVYFIDIGATVSFPAPDTNDREYRQIIQPYLYGQGINKVDAVFLSHEHLDHYGSLPYLIEDIPVDKVIISNFYETDANHIRNWTSNGAEITVVENGDVIQHGKAGFKVVGPIKHTSSPDDNSLVLYTEIGGLSWIFTGDIGKDAEKNILKEYPDINADILKVAHHGSNTSTDPAFAKQFNEKALISVGRNNMYGHPGSEVITTLEESGLEIYRTDVHGAVQYRFKGDKGRFNFFLNNEE